MNILHVLYKRDTGTDATTDISIDSTAVVEGTFVMSGAIESLPKHEVYGEEIAKVFDIDRLERQELEDGEYVGVKDLETVCLPDGAFHTLAYVEWLEDKNREYKELLGLM